MFREKIARFNISQFYVIKIDHWVHCTNDYWHSWIYTKIVGFRHLTIITVSKYYRFHDKNFLGNHKCTASHYIITDAFMQMPRIVVQWPLFLCQCMLCQCQWKSLSPLSKFRWLDWLWNMYWSVCSRPYHCFSGKLCYLQHSCGGDTIVYR